MKKINMQYGFCGEKGNIPRFWNIPKKRFFCILTSLYIVVVSTGLRLSRLKVSELIRTVFIRRSVICSIFLFAWLIVSSSAVDSQVAAATSPFSIDQSAKGMTLWEMLVAGGAVMIVITLVSIVAGAIIFYDFTMLNVNKLVPREFFDEIIRKLKAKNVEDVKDLCIKENNNILARITLAGIDKFKKNSKDDIVKDVIEHRARIEIGNLWQNLNYLSDIVAVAPLLGLLGTVLGMIQAFQAVPLQSTGVKTSLLVAGISKAMVATAAGLVVAIIVLMAYSYFRGKVQEITNAIEIYSTDIVKMMENL